MFQNKVHSSFLFSCNCNLDYSGQEFSAAVGSDKPVKTQRSETHSIIGYFRFIQLHREVIGHKQNE